MQLSSMQLSDMICISKLPQAAAKKYSNPAPYNCNKTHVQELKYKSRERSICEEESDQFYERNYRPISVTQLSSCCAVNRVETSTQVLGLG